GLVELVHVDERLRGFTHRFQRLGPHERSAVACRRPRCVDHPPDAESLVDGVGHYATPSSFIARTARANAVSVSSMIASVWQVPTSARAPLKSTPFRMSAWRSARLRPASFASRRRQSSWSTD